MRLPQNCWVEECCTVFVIKKPLSGKWHRDPETWSPATHPAITASWHLQGYRWDMGLWMQKSPISMAMLAAESKPELQQHGLRLTFVFQISSQYIYFDSISFVIKPYLQDSLCDMASFRANPPYAT